MTMRDTSLAKPPVMSERRVAYLSGLIVAMGPLALSLFTPAMPAIVDAFASTEAYVKLTISFYFAGFCFAQLVCGPLSDGFGRKPILMIFLGIYVFASLLALLAPTIELLIGARFLQGVGAAAGIAISRAIVRDLFTGESSARIMNVIGIMLGFTPAFAPTLGGITMHYADWHAIFVIKMVGGLIILSVIHLALVETGSRDPSRLRPAALARSYASLLKSRYFLSSTITMASTMGTIYTLASLLPFVLMDRVGLSPAQFGFSMLMQSGSFIVGSIVMRPLMMRFSSLSLVPVGLCFVALGATLNVVLLHLYEPTFLLVTGPLAIYTFGIPMIMPAMSTAAMAPFPHIAGAAAAMIGFMQMASGLLGSSLFALFDDPVVALTLVAPLFGGIGIASYAVFRTLPTPPLSGVTGRGAGA